VLRGGGIGERRGLPRPLGEQDRARADRRIDSVVVGGAAVVWRVAPGGLGTGPARALYRIRRGRRAPVVRPERVVVGDVEGERPTRVRNKDPLKPLPVPGKFLRPIIDPERAPPRPKDGIGI